jgi:hypothetical protein
MSQINVLESTYDRCINLMNKYFRAIVLMLISIQVLKGTALYENSYARGAYLWSYENGFIKRGLVGTIAMFLNDNNEYRILGIINFFSYLAYFLFLYTIYKFIIKNAQTITQKMVALLFLCSPFILAIGTLLGYFDAWIIILLLTAYNVCDTKNIPTLLYLFIIAIAISIHELSMFFVALPMIFFIWMHADTSSKKKYFLIGSTCFICIVYIILTSRANLAFNNVLEERITNYKHILSTKTGEDFFASLAGYALKNNSLRDLNIFRMIMLVPMLPIYGFFILISNLIALPVLLRQKKYAAALLYMAACYMPLLIILVGWDVDRFTCLTCCSAYIAFLVISKFCPAIIQNPSGKTKFIGIALIAFIALLTYYPVEGVYAEEETLLSKNQQRFLLQYPDKLIGGWKKKMLEYKGKIHPAEKNMLEK